MSHNMNAASRVGIKKRSDVAAYITLAERNVYPKNVATELRKYSKNLKIDMSSPSAMIDPRIPQNHLSDVVVIAILPSF